MDAFRGSTKGYGKNRYYQRLDAEDHDLLHAGTAAAKPPSGRRRKPPTSSSRRPKVVKVARPLPPPAVPQALPSSTAQPGAVAAPPRPAVPARAHLGGGRRRFWRVRLPPRLAFLRRVASAPARLLSRLRRGYVNMMLKFAGAMGGAAPAMGAGYSLPRPALKEYDDKVLVEIYRALVAQGHILVVPAADGAPGAARLVAR